MSGIKPAAWSSCKRERARSSRHVWGGKPNKIAIRLRNRAWCRGERGVAHHRSREDTNELMSKGVLVALSRRSSQGK
ncbi:hypothetical protein G6F68_018398 [Rhizopus microsporus]|nr:hypothetical protein G6F68_018398 [Rhizopus microsporus]